MGNPLKHDVKPISVLRAGRVMPGARWLPWTPEADAESVYDVSLKVAEYLRHQSESVSVGRLKKQLKVDLSCRNWQRAPSVLSLSTGPCCNGKASPDQSTTEHPMTEIPCCVDGCIEPVPVNTFPALCANCKARLDARKAADKAATAPDVDRGRPGQLHYQPTSKAEAAEHRRLLRKASRAGALGA